MKLYVPVSHNGNLDVKSSYAVSLATSFSGQRVFMEDTGGSHADRQMNNVANRFLKTDCDALLIIDCDTVFYEKDIARAVGHLERGVKAVWGLYPKKEDSAPPCVNTWPEVPDPDEHGLVNVRRAGRGFLMVKREVFEALKEDNGGPARLFLNHESPEWSFFRSGVVESEYSALGMGAPEWISEDWMFCEDLRNFLGIPTLLDTGIILAHVGSKTYRFPPDQITRVDGWRSVPGWFTDADSDTYRRIAREIPNGGSFAEMGTWMGRSLSSFYEFLSSENKMVSVHAIDTFRGTISEGDSHAKIVAQCGGTIRGVFESYMRKINAAPIIHEGESLSVVSEIPDASLDALFIDGDHTFEAVNEDVKAWLPKVKPGGIISGHDYDYPEVAAAVHRHIPRERVETIGRCWLVKL